MPLKIKRIYDKFERTDGFRILVDRLWPRGLTKEKAKIDLWLKEIAPSNELRKWYSHDPNKWVEFKRQYVKELKNNQEAIDLIQKQKGIVILLFGTKEEKFNNAIVLTEYIKNKRG